MHLGDPKICARSINTKQQILASDGFFFYCCLRGGVAFFSSAISDDDSSSPPAVFPYPPLLFDYVAQHHNFVQG